MESLIRISGLCSKNSLHKKKKKDWALYLEGVHIAQPVLNMTVHYQLGQTQDLTTQMESVAKTGLLTLLMESKKQKICSKAVYLWYYF